MGEAKRRKRLDPNYGKGKHGKAKYGARRVDAPLDWKQVRGLTLEEIELAARQSVPAWLAAGFSQALDEGIEILPSANLPHDWPYRMRCVEFYSPAMDWVRLEILTDASLSPEEYPPALANACRVLAMASILAEQATMELELGA